MYDNLILASVADTTIEITDPKIGRVRVTHWRDFHFRTTPERPMQIVRVEVIELLGRNFGLLVSIVLILLCLGSLLRIILLLVGLLNPLR